MHVCIDTATPCWHATLYPTLEHPIIPTAEVCHHLHLDFHVPPISRATPWSSLALPFGQSPQRFTIIRTRLSSRRLSQHFFMSGITVSLITDRTVSASTPYSVQSSSTSSTNTPSTTTKSTMSLSLSSLSMYCACELVCLSEHSDTHRCQIDIYGWLILVLHNINKVGPDNMGSFFGK